MKPLNFTVKHEKIIKDMIIQHPYNLQKAFRMASGKIQLFNAKQVERYWYTYLRYDEEIIVLTTSKFKAGNTKVFTTATSKVKCGKHQIRVQYNIPFK